MQPLSFKVTDRDDVHPIPTSIGETPGNAVPRLTSYTVENPWAGAYTKVTTKLERLVKTFMHRDSVSQEMDGTGTKPYTLVSKLAAEFIGVILFVFIGSLSALKSTGDNMITHAALGHGFTIFVLVASFGHISGGHFNPAVTFGVSLAGRMNPLLIIPYWLAQLLGSLVGSLLVRAVTTTDEYRSILGGATVLPASEAWYQGLVVEVILTAILIQTVLCCAVDAKDNMIAPLAIGLTISLDIIGAGSISGASMNPARSFGPCVSAALLADVPNRAFIWTSHYIYWAGPFAGSAISAILFRTMWSRGYDRLLP